MLCSSHDNVPPQGRILSTRNCEFSAIFQNTFIGGALCGQWFCYLANQTLTKLSSNTSKRPCCALLFYVKNTKFSGYVKAVMTITLMLYNISNIILSIYKPYYYVTSWQ
jgi:hypothetical protein